MLRFFLIVVCIFQATISWADNSSQKLEELLGKFQTLTANFAQFTANGNANEYMQQSEGRMFLQRPGKFRWEITKPNKQILIANKNTLWIYDADLAQASKRKIDYKTNGPAVLLSSSFNKLTQDFDIKQNNMTMSTDKEMFILTPKIKQGAIFQEVRLIFTQKKLSEMFVVDNLNQKIKFVFSDIEVNAKVNSMLFEFKAPKDVDIVL